MPNFSLRVLTIVLLNTTLAINAAATTDNGFDLRGASVPIRSIQQGGPPKDGIPALNSPRFQTASEAIALQPDAPILGIVQDGHARAYPIAVMNWHELANDQIAGKGVLISYCPLCGTGMAFDASTPTGRLEFGVSGLLYNSDVLFYDRETQSLWSQIERTAISGPRKGDQLSQLPLEHTTWAHWRSRYPDTLVLSEDQGFSRDYSDDPYAGYEKTRDLFFKVANKAPRQYHTKERVLGLRAGNKTLAIPFVELRKQGLDRFKVSFNDQPVTIEWHARTETATAYNDTGEPQVHTIAFWFAWYAFHPNTEVYVAP